MPLQKSFSDQNHSAKARQQQQQGRSQWRRNQSFQGLPAPRHNLQSKPLQEKPAIPVSTATKNKLSMFQFGGQSATEPLDKAVISLVSDDEKENLRTGGRGAHSSGQDGGRIEDERAVQPDLPRKDVPSTPGSRLALPDLLGMGDVKRAVENVSPDERIDWNYGKEESGISPASAFGGIRKAKKRARSSSPISSSPAQTSNHFPTKGDNLNPQVDPGSELWGRYSLNGSHIPTPREPSIPALAHLMHTSSPQPSKEGTTPRSTFRRANSCGNQFPKRRRVGGSDGDVFTESAAIGPSKLAVLIERVQEGLIQPKQSLPPSEASESPGESIKTPSKNTGEKPLEWQVTSKGAYSLPTASSSERPHILRRDDDETRQENEPSEKSNSSDYGDFDDDDLNDSLFSVLESKPAELALKAHIPSISKLNSESHAKSSGLGVMTGLDPMSAKKSSSILENEDNEFGDFDDDILGTDLENVVSQFDNEDLSTKTSRGGTGILNAQKTCVASAADSDDEFGLDDVDFDAVDAAVTQSVQRTADGPLPSTQKKQAIQRYLVTSILPSEYTNSKGRMCREKILLLQADNNKTTKVVNLRGTWYDTPATVKAYVHVIGTFDASGRCIVDDDHNILVLHPDHLVSATVVGDSFGCTRRAVLQDRIKATNDSSAPLVYGTILHEIFQAAMVANRWDSVWLGEIIEDIATKHLEDLYTLRIQIPQAIEYLQSKIGELQLWAEVFVSSQPKIESVVKTGNGETAKMCVNKLLDVEEHVWSPMYGLKGNIDATVQVTMQDDKNNRTLTVPFEVKTGKSQNASHRAQTALYTLLLSDRYDIQVAYGILYYMETSETIRIPAIRHELRHMIMQRNELACFVRERHTQLPPMLKKENMCGRCYAKVPCFIYHRLADDGDGETSGMKTKFDEVVKHLTPKHKEFFLKWDDLLTKEEKESMKFRRELWTMFSSEREKLGRCFSNVVIQPGSAYEELNNPKINRFHYILTKQQAPAGFSFLESEIVLGEPIVISDEDGHFALANGFVTNVRKQRITVAVDRRLHNARIRRPGFSEFDNQVFSGIMEVTPDNCPSQTIAEAAKEPVRYRLDKDEFSNGMATARNNIIQVMADGPFGSRQIRGLVVDLNAPRFKIQSTAYVLRDRENINVDQRRAIQKVMSAEDYALVLGMPGTGKTTTIAHIIRALVSQGKSVLLTSYTHSAVDNILLKLKDDHMGILRLGTLSKIHADVQEFATLAATTKTSFEEIRSAWHDSPIVATTCLGINHPIFNERTFDYCIVDEASQITLPVCLGPIRLARTFILVGDHYQLPPLVKNEEARTGGLDISLFKHLSDTHPSAIVYLEHQYRMCEDVMALSNNLIYSGRLKCGSPEVANRCINIPNISGLNIHHFSPSTLSRSQKTVCLGPTPGHCWIRTLVDPSTKVSFINTDPLIPLSREQAKGNRTVNPAEATICTQLVESLLSVGVPASSIGVMTHYRSQLALLKNNLHHHANVEMHTTDRFQGRDKEVVILSLVRSNEEKSIGDLLKDWRRINVAFTRAKTKLLVIGSRETLLGRDNGGENGQVEMVTKFVRLMEEKNWVFDLPKGALEDHYFEESGTQHTSTAVNRSGGTQFRGFEDEDRAAVGGHKKRSALSEPREDKENTNMRRPKKKICGNKPFKMPRMSVLGDLVNEAFH